MPGFDLRIRMEPTGEVWGRRFQRFADNIHNFIGLWPRIAADFQRIEQERFDSEGPGWAPLAPGYALWKSQHGGAPILQYTRALMASLTTPATIESMTATELVMGTRVRYAHFHQFGTDRMPARPVIDISESDRRGWDRLVHRWLLEQRAEAGV